MRILAFETSCDETAVAVYDSEQGLLSHVLHSQISVHAEYGGVVPELASRDHVRKILPLARQALREADCHQDDIHGIAYTAGPGLMGALLVGVAFARSLAWAWQKPSIRVHHMEAHLLAPMLEANAPEMPFVALLVSGGHTQLVQVDGVGEYTLLGETLDDAAGEAFDKTAKILGLAYPGGPAIAKLAEEGDPARYQFPRPMVKRPGCDFSFSGLKTHAMQCFMQSDKSQATKANIARAFEEAVVDTLVIKCQRALEETHLETLVVAGGVGANQRLRHALNKLDANVFFPRLEFCTDNAAMVAYAGCARMMRGEKDGAFIDVRARWVM